MDAVTKTVGDIFAMRFDVIIPFSGCIVALLAALILFGIRYGSFRRNRRRYLRREERAAQIAGGEEPHLSAAGLMPGASPAPASSGKREGGAAEREAAPRTAPGCDRALAEILIDSLGRAQSACPDVDMRFRMALRLRLHDLRIKERRE